MVCASTKTARPRVSNGRFLHADQVGPFSRFRLAIEREGSDLNLRIQPHLPQQSNCSDEAANRKATTLPLVGTLQFPFGIISPGGGGRAKGGGRARETGLTVTTGREPGPERGLQGLGHPRPALTVSVSPTLGNPGLLLVQESVRIRTRVA